MEGATHYIEQFRYKDNESKVFQSPQPLNLQEMNRALKHTNSSGTMKTIAIWHIKPKPNVVIAVFDKDLNTTIVNHA